jgi:putative ABC transport system permease protein
MSLRWSTLAMNEWRRRPLRSAVTAAGVAVAIASLFSLLSFQTGYRVGLASELNRLGAHILVVPKGCPYDAASMALHGASWPCYLKTAYLDEVRAVHGVVAAAPVLMTARFDAAGAQHVFMGIDDTIRPLKPHWRLTGHFPAAENELLAGAEVVAQQQWRLGQEVSLPGLEGATGTLVGVLEPTRGAEDGFLFLRLRDAQRRFGHDQELTHILVRLADPNLLDEAVRQLRGCGAAMDMNVVPLAHLFRTIQDLMNSTRVLLGAVGLVALLIAGAGVSNTVLMAVAERTREIGVMRALGASVGDVFRLVWTEALQVCLAGGVVGVALAFIGSRWLEAWLRARLPFAPTDTLVSWDGWIALASLAGALGVGSVSGLLPAWRAARLPPAAAMRSPEI